MTTLIEISYFYSLYINKRNIEILITFQIKTENLCGGYWSIWIVAISYHIKPCHICICMLWSLCRFYVLKGEAISSCVFLGFTLNTKKHSLILLCLYGRSRQAAKKNKTKENEKYNYISPSLWLSSSPLPFIVYISSS